MENIINLEKYYGYLNKKEGCSDCVNRCEAKSMNGMIVDGCMIESVFKRFKGWSSSSCKNYEMIRHGEETKAYRRKNTRRALNTGLYW